MQTEASSMSWYFSAPSKVDCCHGASRCCCCRRKVISPWKVIYPAVKGGQKSAIDLSIYCGCSGCRTERTCMQIASTVAGCQETSAFLLLWREWNPGITEIPLTAVWKSKSGFHPRIFVGEQLLQGNLLGSVIQEARFSSLYLNNALSL